MSANRKNKLSSMIGSTVITNFVLVDAELDSQIYAYATDATLFSSRNLSPLPIINPNSDTIETKAKLRNWKTSNPPRNQM